LASWGFLLNLLLLDVRFSVSQSVPRLRQSCCVGNMERFMHDELVVWVCESTLAGSPTPPHSSFPGSMATTQSPADSALPLVKPPPNAAMEAWAGALRLCLASCKAGDASHRASRRLKEPTFGPEHACYTFIIWQPPFLPETSDKSRLLNRYSHS